MKSILSSALLALSTVVAAPVASAATGSYDGSYDFHYDAMNLAVHCGYVDNYYGVVDGGYGYYHFPLEGEALPEDVFDPLLQWRLEVIESMNLRPAAEVAAKLNAYAFFTGLRYALNDMVSDYPQGMEVALNESLSSPTGASYLFDGSMTDENDLEIMQLSGIANTVTGDFGLLPMLWTESGVDYEGVGHRVSLGVQVGGSFRAGYGAARWQAQQLSAVDYGYGYGAVWGCGINNVTGFEITADADEIPAARQTTQANHPSYKLNAKDGAKLAQTVRADAVRELKAHSSLSRQQLQAAEQLSRLIAR